MNGRTLSRASLLSRATARNSCREKYRANENVLEYHSILKGSGKAGYSSFSLGSHPTKAFSFSNTSGAIYCGVPQNVAVVCPNGTFILHKPKSTNLI